MNVLRIPVARGREQAVITRDRMRVDIEAEFFVRVTQKPEAVAAAAATLGRRTMDAERLADLLRSEEHTSELQSLMRISYAVFCLKKKKTNKKNNIHKSTKHRPHQTT